MRSGLYTLILSVVRVFIRSSTRVGKSEVRTSPIATASHCATSHAQHLAPRNPYLHTFYSIQSLGRVADILNASGALDPGSSPGRDVAACCLLLVMRDVGCGARADGTPATPRHISHISHRMHPVNRFTNPLCFACQREPDVSLSVLSESDAGRCHDSSLFKQFA